MDHECDQLCILYRWGTESCCRVKLKSVLLFLLNTSNGDDTLPLGTGILQLKQSPTLWELLWTGSSQQQESSRWYARIEALWLKAESFPSQLLHRSCHVQSGWGRSESTAFTLSDRYKRHCAPTLEAGTENTLTDTSVYVFRNNIFRLTDKNGHISARNSQISWRMWAHLWTIYFEYFFFFKRK